MNADWIVPVAAVILGAVLVAVARWLSRPSRLERLLAEQRLDEAVRRAQDKGSGDGGDA